MGPQQCPETRNQTPCTGDPCICAPIKGGCAPDAPSAAPQDPDETSALGTPSRQSPRRPRGRLTLVMIRGSPCSRPPFRVKPQGAPPLSRTSTRRAPWASPGRSCRARGSAPSMVRDAQPLQPLRSAAIHSVPTASEVRGHALRTAPGRLQASRPLQNELCNLESAARRPHAGALRAAPGSLQASRPPQNEVSNLEKAQPLRSTPTHSGQHGLAQHHQGASRRPGHRHHRHRRRPLLKIFATCKARRGPGREGRREGAGQGKGEGHSRAREPGPWRERAQRGLQSDCAEGAKGFSGFSSCALGGSWSKRALWGLGRA